MIGSLRYTKEAPTHKKERIHDKIIQEQEVEHAIELSKKIRTIIEKCPNRPSSKVGKCNYIGYKF